MTTTATTTRDALTRASRVHNALRVVTEAASKLPANVVLVDGSSVYVIAPNALTARRWLDTFPHGHVVVGGAQVPLHLAVEGDVEGGRS